MGTRIAYAAIRLLSLGAAATFGYVAAYIPLMNLLLDKRQPVVFFLILGISIASAYTCAKYLDLRLPKASR